MSKRAAAAALYSPALCEAICRGLAKQKSYDNSGLAGGQRFGRKSFKLMMKKLKPIGADKDLNDDDDDDTQVRGVLPHA